MQISLLLGTIIKAAWDYPAEGGNGLLRDVRTYQYVWRQEAEMFFRFQVLHKYVFDFFMRLV